MTGRCSESAGSWLPRSGIAPVSASVASTERHLGLGSYNPAWLLVQKIRRAMDLADGFPLIVNVQADETTIPYRPKGSDPPRPGRNADGTLMIAGVVEVFEEDKPGRVKLQGIKDQSGPTLKRFVEGATVRGTRTAADGWADCKGIKNRKPVAVGTDPAHEVLDWIHRVFANLKRFVEWSFRWN